MKQQFIKRQKQPITHQHNTKEFQEIFCCCCFNYSVSQQNLQIYYQLKKQCSISTQQDKQSNIIELKQLYKDVFQKQLITDYKTNEWKYLGFQGNNPFTDFRGGGMMSLKQIRHFYNKNKSIVQQMNKQQNEFLFATSSINVTFYMKYYFHLRSDLDLQKDKDIICSRKAFKLFCMITRSVDIFHELHQLFLNDLFKIWLQLKKNNKFDLMMFGEAIMQLKNKVDDCFNQTLKYPTFQKFKQHYLSIN